MNNDPVKQVEELALKAMRRTYAKAREQELRTTKQVVMLPFWSDKVRGIPNDVLRSALFNARNRRQKRVYFRGTDITVVGDGRVTYRGEELRQDDELVWLQALHLAREQPLGQRIEFTPYSFVKAIGWPIKGQSYERLKICLSRMQATAVSIYSRRLNQGVSVSLIRKFEWKDKNGRLDHWRVWIEPEMQRLFGNTHYTKLGWEQRLALPDGIASKIHAYYATHKEPYRVRTETLSKLCASNMDKKGFRKRLIRALDCLVAIGFLKSWQITDDLVDVKRV
jgi:hypothetical protein